jgi:hypothetical protein
LRDGIAFRAAGHGQGGDNGQGERDLELERRAAADRAFDLDGAADLLDIGAHDVHADAAPGEIGHLVRRGKSGLEDEID